MVVCEISALWHLEDFRKRAAISASLEGLKIRADFSELRYLE